MSRKQTAGGRSRRLWSPAAESSDSKPSIRFAVQARACCAWYIARSDCSESGEIRSARSTSAMASAPLPAAIAGAMTSDAHQAPS